MCIFSQPIDQVGSTRIFVADLGHGIHATAYQMAFRATRPVDMILPVPALKGSGDEALAFVDLGGYDDFFEDLSRCFPRPRGVATGGGYGIAKSLPEELLVVHEVGDYEASYVPSVADFHRLDPRFRLPKAAWDTLPNYQDFGFAVFQLRPGQDMQKVHPIAYRYPADRLQELFFPTVHVHDGGYADPRAGFDHELYAQGNWSTPRPGMPWEVGRELPGRVVDMKRSRGIVAPDVALRRERLRGKYSNADIVVLGSEGELRAEVRAVRTGSRPGQPMSWQEFGRRGRRRSDGTY